MLTIAFCVTLGLGIKEGIIASVAMSLVAMIYRSTKPHFAVLGKMPNSNEYRNIKRFENLEINKEVLVIRYDADLYFANTNHFIESITQKVDSKGSALKLLVLHAGSISHIDSTAFQALTDLIEDLDSQGITLYFSHMIGPTRDFLKRSGLLKMDSGRNSFLDIESAIAAFKNER
jgi:SulP family sulfate permease